MNGKTDKLLSHLGLAMRAGQLVTGEEAVLKAIRSRTAYLVLMAEDASDNTKKKMKDKCGSYEVPLLVFCNRMRLGKATGKRERVLLAVMNEGFSNLLITSWEEHLEV